NNDNIGFKSVFQAKAVLVARSSTPGTRVLVRHLQLRVRPTARLADPEPCRPSITDPSIDHGELRSATSLDGKSSLLVAILLLSERFHTWISDEVFATIASLRRRCADTLRLPRCDEAEDRRDQLLSLVVHLAAAFLTFE